MSSRPSKLALVGAAFAACAALAAFSGAQAQTAEEKSQAQAEIWALEQSVYAGRASGDMSNYEQATHPQYMAWPPWAAAPFGKTGLKRTQTTVAGKAEKLKMEFVDFSMSGDTAIIYYQTHRTALGDGTPVNQFYETIHVWKKDGGAWKVMGGMARERPPRD